MPDAARISFIQAAKLDVVAATGLAKDALHIYVGLFVLFAVALLLRKSLSSLLPLLAVFVVTAIGEMLDARDDIASIGHWRVAASVHDIVNTMFWPTVLSLLLRYTKFVR